MRTKTITKTTSLQPSLSEDEDGEWNCALSKGMRRRLKATGRTSPLSVRLPVPKNSEKKPRTLLYLPDDSPSALKAKFGAALAQFLPSEGSASFVARVLSELRARIRPSAKILCLGLGNPAVDSSSLRQLAFLTALVEASDGIFAPARTFIYDPVLKITSRDFIRRQGFRVLSSNLEGHYHLPRDQSTFVFLPHCPLALAEGLVSCNWHREVLNQLTFLSCPLKPRNADNEVPHLAFLQPFRNRASLKTERDFEGLRLEWFYLPPEVNLVPASASSQSTIPSGDLLTFDNVSSFIDGCDAQTIDGLV
ncbi:unnamed protein product [Mesocestoides corti]|uniref:SRR1 domain-containing protein n=1 Tax=Mesocestoides corti TaxID=53468 RepID=A0A0R3U4V6_MESCO|nr:unnamed protein product [Mesocestoides corti]